MPLHLAGAGVLISIQDIQLHRSHKAISQREAPREKWELMRAVFSAQYKVGKLQVTWRKQRGCYPCNAICGKTERLSYGIRSRAHASRRLGNPVSQMIMDSKEKLV